MNEKGFVIPSTLAKRIQQRRGKMFHSTPDMTEEDVGAFSYEISTAVAIVLFHTFEDLGIDPALLTDRYSALTDMPFLMKRPLPFQQAPGASVMTLAEAMKQVNDGVTPNKVDPGGEVAGRSAGSPDTSERSGLDAFPE